MQRAFVEPQNFIQNNVSMIKMNAEQKRKRKTLSLNKLIEERDIKRGKIHTQKMCL